MRDIRELQGWVLMRFNNDLTQTAAGPVPLIIPNRPIRVI